MNKVVLIGRLTHEPDTRYTQGNEPLAVCRFSIAVDKPYSSNRKEGEPTADFINCVCFGKRGEAIGQYFHKGNKIALTGRIQTRTWQDKNGNNRYATEVVLDDFEFCENKNTENNSYSTNYSTNNNTPTGFTPISDDDLDDDDLPF